MPDEPSSESEKPAPQDNLGEGDGSGGNAADSSGTSESPFQPGPLRLEDGVRGWFGPPGYYYETGATGDQSSPEPAGDPLDTAPPQPPDVQPPTYATPPIAGADVPASYEPAALDTTPPPFEVTGVGLPGSSPELSVNYETPEGSVQQADARRWQEVADRLSDRINEIAGHDWTDAEKVQAIQEVLAGLPDAARFGHGVGGWDLEIWNGNQGQFFTVKLPRPQEDLLTTALYTSKMLPPDQIGLTNTAYFLANTFGEVADALGPGDSGAGATPAEGAPPDTQPPTDTPSVLQYSDDSALGKPDMQGTWSEEQPAQPDPVGHNVEGGQGDPVTASPPESGTIEVRVTGQSGDVPVVPEVEPISETPPILNAGSVLSYSEETLVMVGGDPTVPLAPTPTPENLRDARDKAQRELLSEPLEEFPEEHVIVRPGVLPIDDEPGRPVSGNQRPTFWVGLRGQGIKKLNRKKTVLAGFGAGAAGLLALALGGVFGGGGDNTVAGSGGEPAPVNPLVAVQQQQAAQPTVTATHSPTLTPEPTATLTPVPAPDTAGATGVQGSQDGVPATGSIEAGPAPSSQEQAPVPAVQEPAPVVQQPVAVSEEQVLQPNGTVHVILDNTVTKITGNCPLASPSNPGQQIAVNDHVPGQGDWTLAGSGNVFTLTTNDGLTGIFNPATGVFSVQSADSTRSSTGPVSGDGLSLSGTSVFKPSGTCTLDLSFTGAFDKPLFIITTVATTPGFLEGPTPVTPAGRSPLEIAIEEAYEGAFTNAVRTGDETYLLSHDSQVAIDYYGFSRCQEHFANVPPDPTFTIVVTGEITGPSAWTWVYQGNVIGENIPEVYSIPAQVTQKGATVSAVLHASWDGDLVVYSPC